MTPCSIRSYRFYTANIQTPLGFAVFAEVYVYNAIAELLLYCS